MRSFCTAVVVCLLFAPVAASAVTHAFQVYDYHDRFYYPYGPEGWMNGATGFWNSPNNLGSNTGYIVPHLHSGLTDPPSDDPSLNRLCFDVSTFAPAGSSAWDIPAAWPTLSDYDWQASFSWQCSTNGRYRLELQGYHYSGGDPPGWTTAWSVTPGPGYHSGTVSASFWGDQSRFVLTVVPEPSSILTLLCGGCGVIVVRRPRIR